MLHRALVAFASEDPEEARGVLAADDAIDDIQSELVALARREIADSQQAPACVEVILVAMHLERVADHATNVAEDVILVAEARNVKHLEKLLAASR